MLLVALLEGSATNKLNKTVAIARKMASDMSDLLISEVDKKIEAVDPIDKEKIPLTLSSCDFRSYAGDNALNEFTIFSITHDEEKKESKVEFKVSKEDDSSLVNNELKSKEDADIRAGETEKEDNVTELTPLLEDAASDPHLERGKRFWNELDDVELSEDKMHPAESATVSKESVVNELRVSPARHKLSLDDDYGLSERTPERSDNSDPATGSYASNNSDSSNENVAEALRNEVIKNQRRIERCLDEDQNSEAWEDEEVNFCIEQRKVKYSAKGIPRSEKRRADDSTVKSVEPISYGDNGISAEHIGFKENQEGLKKMCSRNVSFLKDKAHDCVDYIRTQVGDRGKKYSNLPITDDENDDESNITRVISDISRPTDLTNTYKEGERPISREKASASDGRVHDSLTTEAHKNSSMFDGIALKRVQEEVGLDKAACRSGRKMTVVASSKSESAAGATLYPETLRDIRGTSCGELLWDTAYDSWCEEEEALGRAPPRSISSPQEEILTYTILQYWCVAVLLVLICLVFEFSPLVTIMLASSVALACFKLSERRENQYRYRTLAMEPTYAE